MRTPSNVALIAQLHPTIQLAAADLLYRAEQEGIHLIITQGYRSSKDQADLWNKGRVTVGAHARPGRPLGDIVTKAPPGFSWHEYRLAFDVAPADKEGNPHWPEDAALWLRIGELGEAVGLEWGGRWQTIVDRPHFQHRGGLTLAAARAGERPRYNAGEMPEEFPLGH